MNLAIFYTLPNHKQELESVIEENQDFWMRFHSVEFYSMYEEFTFNNDNLFFLFLVNPESASSATLLKLVNQLKSAGVNDQSIIFALNDMDKITPHNQNLVSSDLIKMLKPFITSPHLFWFSSRCFVIYQKYMEQPNSESLKKDVRFAFWDEQQQTYLGLRSMMESGRMTEVKDLARIDELIKLLSEQFLAHPARSIRRDPSKYYIFINEMNKSIFDYLAQVEDLIVKPINNLDEYENEVITGDTLLFYTTVKDFEDVPFSKLLSLHCLLLIDGGQDYTVPEIQEKISSMQERYPEIAMLAINSYYIQYLQCLGDDGVIEQLSKDVNIVIHDKYGFPAIKTKVPNWKDTLAIESGIETVLHKLNERRHLYASTI